MILQDGGPVKMFNSSGNICFIPLDSTMKIGNLHFLQGYFGCCTLFKLIGNICRIINQSQVFELGADE